MQHPNSKKNWHIAMICLSVIMLGILFYFFTANISTVVAFAEKLNFVLRPVYYGTVIAFLLLPCHEYFYREFSRILPLKKEHLKNTISNALAILCSLFVAFLIIFLLLAMVLPQLYLSIQGLFQSIPQDFTIRTPQWLQDFFVENPDFYQRFGPFYEGCVVNLNNWIQTEIIPTINSVDDFLSFAESTILPSLSGVVTGVSQFMYSIIIFVKDIVVAVFISIYILAQKRTFSAQGKKLIYAFLPVAWGDLVLEEVRNAYRILSNFINGKLIDSLIIGMICLVGCNLLKIPYSTLIATIIGITNIIPFFGPFIGAIPCGFIIFFVSPLKCLYFAGFVLALQQFDGNILGPKILGESTGLSSFWVLFSIILFGGIFGFAGMLFGVPIFATFYSMLSRLVKYLLSKKNMPEETAAYQGHLEGYQDITTKK